MKRLISLFLMAFLCISAFGQKLTIELFKEKTSDLAARTNVRTDANDNACALVKVEVALAGVKFEGNVIGDVEHNVNEYWVYMSEGSKRLNVRHPDYVNCYVTFADYGITSLVGKTTYELVILRPEYNNASAVASARDVTASSSAQEQVTKSQDHEAVDLGLSVKWASCNVGAKRPEEYGDYFAWGETKPKDSYTWENLKYCSGSTEKGPFTKYVVSSTEGTVDYKTTLDPEDDAAHVNWGGSWRMPTRAELDELRTNCTWTWIIQNNVNGYKVTGPNGNSIFLPAAGCHYDKDLYAAGSYGDYWSSSLHSSFLNYAYHVSFESGRVSKNDFDRFIGISVRPVCP